MDTQTEERDQNFASSVLQARADRLIDELTRLKRRVRKESIHDTRVASRRMRSALDAFQDLFPPRPWKSTYGSIKKVTRILGKPRETEVTLALLQELSSNGDMAENISCEYLMQKLERQLASMKRQMKKKLGSFDARSLRSKIDFLLSGMGPTEGRKGPKKRKGSAPKSGPPKALHEVSQPTLFPLYETSLERGQRIIREASFPILSYSGHHDFASAGDDELHSLRIAAKKLRYAMEIFDDVWPGGLKKEMALARAVQNAGGEFHDWCVLSNMLNKDIQGMAKMPKKRTTHMAFQLGRLMSNVEEKRSELRSKILAPLTRLQVRLQSLQGDLQGAAVAKEHTGDRV